VSIILKKSARKDQRVSAKAICWARPVGTERSLTVQMNDLSLGGMSFHANKPGFNVKSEVEILFKDSSSRLFSIQGRIVAVVKDRGNVYRHSVEFRKRLTEDQMTTLLQIVPIDRFVKAA
jgi:c-di-GMP-binding flagellar brake protein YcgR